VFSNNFSRLQVKNVEVLYFLIQVFFLKRVVYGELLNKHSRQFVHKLFGANKIFPYLTTKIIYSHDLTRRDAYELHLLIIHGHNNRLIHALERQGFPSRRSHHRFRITFGGQSRLTKTPSHEKRELSSLTSSPLKEGDTKYSSRSPVKPSIELGEEHH